MLHDFPYLKDRDFLKNFDQIKLKQQYIKIIILTFNEIPIQQVQGRAISGNFTFDGASAMRRTGNITMVADDYKNDLRDTKHLFSINKKVEILVGFLNTTNRYTDYDIIWFPLGIYVITSPVITHSNNETTISLTLHDKMALLNGQCGGILPATVTFHEVEDIGQDGDTQIKKVTIYQIIQELVNHFGGQQLGKIIISDISNKIKKVIKWQGKTKLYYYHETQQDKQVNIFTTDINEIDKKDENTIIEFSKGQDIGYVLDDFFYPTELIGNQGDSITSILDKIKNILGNYEYFYDINGNFVFQQIKNYLNNSYSTFLIKEINANNYLVDYAKGKTVYEFTDGKIIQSYTNSSQYQQIKNDFVVWGKKTTVTGQEKQIRYHLAIDSKPKIGNTYTVFLYEEDDGIVKAKKPIKFSNKNSFPKTGEIGIYYYAEDEKKVYKWDIKNQEYFIQNGTIENITTKDYRTELYLAGVTSQPFGLNSNYYYTQLNNEWPKVYNLKKGEFFNETYVKQPNEMDFFLDFIDTQSSLSEFNVNNIGRRTLVIQDDSINCIFEPDATNVIIIQADQLNTEELVLQCSKQGQPYSLVSSDIYNELVIGGMQKSAYQEIRKELYQYTNYNQQISLTTLPIYYLEPNTRIAIRDNESGIFGDYMIKTISLPINVDGTMSMTCIKALERI